MAGKLWFVARGVQRLLGWAAPRQTVWNCIECTHIGNPDRKPTPHEVRCEVWMSLIHGSRGLIYFVHQFKPAFREAALLDDPAMLAGVTELNRQITELSPVIKSPPVQDAVQLDIAPTGAASGVAGEAKVADVPGEPVAFTVREREGWVYLFAVEMRGATTEATFRTETKSAEIEVIGERRGITLKNGAFTDVFRSWDVHLYRWKVTEAR